jgi:putative phosphoribosyl transferase
VLDADRARELRTVSDRLQLASPFVFRDRLHAGAVLARALDRKVDEDAVVVGLARGGVVLAARVARALGLPLDFVAVRKVTHPLEPEYARGAVAPGAQAYVRARDGLTDDQLAIAVALAQCKARALNHKLRGARRQPSFVGRTALLVDDGIATGATMIAAARWAIERGAGRVIAAAPVGAQEAVDLVRREVDEVVCPYTADDLGAVALCYLDFPQVDDEDVAELLRAARQTRPTLVAR